MSRLKTGTRRPTLARFVPRAGVNLYARILFVPFRPAGPYDTVTFGGDLTGREAVAGVRLTLGTLLPAS